MQLGSRSASLYIKSEKKTLLHCAEKPKCCAGTVKCHMLLIYLLDAERRKLIHGLADWRHSNCQKNAKITYRAWPCKSSAEFPRMIPSLTNSLQMKCVAAFWKKLGHAFIQWSNVWCQRLFHSAYRGIKCGSSNNAEFANRNLGW